MTEYVTPPAATTEEIPFRQMPLTKHQLRKPVNHAGKALLFQFTLMVPVAFLLSFLVQIIYMMILNFQNLPGGSMAVARRVDNLVTSPLFLLIFQLVFMLLANTIPFFLCAKKTGISPKLFFARSKRSFGFVAGVGILGLVAAEATTKFSELLQWLLEKADLHPKMPSGLEFPKNDIASIVLFVICVCILAPITEEFLCRGVLLRIFRRFGDRFAIVASALVFGVIHGNIYQTPMAFVFGLFLGYVTVKCGSILPAIALHAANNILSTVISAIGAYNEELSEVVYLCSLIILGGAALIVLIVLIVRAVTKSTTTIYEQSPAAQQDEAVLQSEATLYKGKGAALFFSSWAILLFLIAYAGVMTISIIGTV